MADTSQVKEITARLKDGINELFASDKYADYLKTMSRFHNYSTRNTQLIYMQYPGATNVAGFHKWKNEFKRTVKKGSKAIKILAPMPIVIKEDKAVIDPETKKPVLDDDGMPVTEEVEKRFARFKAVSVFDISQTEGKPLPTLIQDLTGNVEQYEAFLDTLRAVSPLPITIKPMPEEKDGTCEFGVKISIREGMSQVQTVSAAVHEITHAILHDRSRIVSDEENIAKKDLSTAEVEAESISYVVCQHFGIETGDNSFGYVATWSKGKDLKELNDSLDTIRKTSAELIDVIDGKFQEIAKERDINFAIGTAQDTLSEQAAVIEPAAIVFSETRNVGETVLMPLLYNNDGNLERTDKRTRVKIEPPIGKYQIYSREINGNSLGYILTNSGKLINIASYEWLKVQNESKFDEIFEAHRKVFEENMQNLNVWVDYTAAAIVNRIADAESHNNPVKEAREERRVQNAENQRNQREIEVKEKETRLNQQMDDISTALINGERYNIETDRYTDTNPLFPLFERYNIDIPIATKGWINRSMSAFQLNTDGSLRVWGHKGMKISSTFAQSVRLLKNAINTEKTKQEESRNIIEQSPNIHIGGIPPLPPPTQKEPEKPQIPYAGKLYKQFADLFPQVFDREYSYIQLGAGGGMMPLSIEWVGDDQISIMHTFTMNGDLCYDPMIVFRVDENTKTMSAIEFQQSVPPIYQTVTEDNGNGISVDGNGRQVEKRGLQRELNDFSVMWFNNISEQGYMPVKGNRVVGKEEIRVTFDADGNPVMPELEKSKTTVLDMSLPDPTLTAAQMNEYGYTQEGMYPLTFGRAVELFDTDHTIYLLCSDNTELMALDRDEIITFGNDGLCGITHEDWERSPIRAGQLAIAANAEASRESELLNSEGNRFGIYQIIDGIKDSENLRFASMKELEERGLSVVRGNYELVYTTTFPEQIDSQRDISPVLDRIYEDFNVNHPADFMGHSLSMSDIVVLKYGNNVSSHYVDLHGFESLAGFLGDEKQEAFFTKPIVEEMTEKIKSEKTEKVETSSQVGNTPQEYTGKTVAQFEEDVRAGRPISLSDFAVAINAERNNRSELSKSKPSLLAQVELGKIKSAQQRLPDTNKIKNREGLGGG